MKRLLELVAQLKQKKSNAGAENSARKFGIQSQKSSRGPENFPMIMLIIGALLLTLQQAEALDARLPAASVGDQLSFRPGMTIAPGAVSIIPARVVTGPWAPPTRTCRLNMRQITHHWGAFTVLAVRTDGIMLSWAGGDTAKGENNCAPAHKLLLSSRGYGELLSTQRSNVRVVPR